ncbi:peptidylprolyl isomerase [Demetria terragena]|uniref:peptidylprolyl isomerase n=1 Tax=Demetria terragena TaxID=63959 RepID=UPI000378D85F|nr:peptidylprolyl isomerase [Demetria terragena]
MSTRLISTLVAVTALAAPAVVVPTANAAADRGHKPAVCEFRPTPDRPAARPVRLPKAKQKSHGTVDVRIATNYGPMTFRLNRDTAPCAVGNLVHLARNNFYDQTQCFRLTNSERLGVLQCGDLIKQEVGGPGYEFDDEVDGTETYPRGTIAMGNQGPGTNGSEFFIVHSHANIDPDYTVLGRLISGYDALDAIVAAGIADPDLDGPPAQPVWIYDVKAGRQGP